MAKVLQNFLIGVGLDTEDYDKGAKNVEGSLGRMRTLVGFTGAAISGAFGLAGTAAINAGKRVHDFNNEAEKLKTPTEYVHNYGRALAALGGNAEDALAAIGSLEERLAEMRAGGTGRFAGDMDLALAGVDISPIRDSQTGEEFLRELARQVPELNKEQQLRVQQALGLSDVVMISLRDGVEAFDAGIERAGELYGEFGRATDEAREFARAIAEINTRFQGIGETLAERVLPGFTGVIDAAGDLIDRNRSLIEKGADVAGENPVGTALATGGGAAAALGVMLRGIGLRGVGMGLTRFGLPGVIAGGALIGGDMAYDWFSNRETPAQSAPYDPDTPFGLSMPLNEINYHDGYKPAPIVESPSSGFITPYESIYGGGEVSNAEAASASPDVIMVHGQREHADRPVTPPRINVQSHLEVQMEMDGRAVDTRVIDVIERRERDTIDDIYSSVDR